jgi:hypothetical protein
MSIIFPHNTKHTHPTIEKVKRPMHAINIQFTMIKRNQIIKAHTSIWMRAGNWNGIACRQRASRPSEESQKRAEFYVRGP